MKKVEKEQVPLAYIERNPLIWLISGLLALVFGYLAYQLLKDVNPAGFMLMIPAAFCAFQTIWLLLNPFALFFEERLEIRQTLFHNQQRFYTDIKNISQDRKGGLFLTYNDDEVEKVNLFGIRRPDIAVLKENLRKQLKQAAHLGQGPA